MTYDACIDNNIQGDCRVHLRELTSLLYSDPETYAGPDPDPTFDLDDELVFMFRWSILVFLYHYLAEMWGLSSLTMLPTSLKVSEPPPPINKSSQTRVSQYSKRCSNRLNARTSNKRSTVNRSRPDGEKIQIFLN